MSTVQEQASQQSAPTGKPASRLPANVPNGQKTRSAVGSARSPLTHSEKPWLWRPGESGNPSGRPAALVEVTRLARTYTQEAIQALVQVLTLKGWRTARARVAAAEALLNRGWGAPVQPVELTQQITLEVIRGLPKDQLVSLRALVAHLQGAQPRALPAIVRSEQGTCEVSGPVESSGEPERARAKRPRTTRTARTAEAPETPAG